MHDEELRPHLQCVPQKIVIQKKGTHLEESERFEEEVPSLLFFPELFMAAAHA